jgi:2-polyprenyl-6-methoxyphenol hydroxylase-like FAD-dependent oxidoreductase
MIRGMTDDVVVLGGGVAGLSAALAFARRGDRVSLVERDGALPQCEPGQLLDRWARAGVPHFRLPHNFLGLARKVLLTEAPDVLDAVLRLGATENRQYELIPGDSRPGDEDLVSICASRPVFEAALRRAVDEAPNVNLQNRARVVGLLVDPNENDPVRVVGARLEDGREVRGDLVVDALGRTSPVVSWLASAGARPPFERRSECGLLYYSRHFRLRPGTELPFLPTLLRGPRGEIGYMAFALFVEDNRTFALALMIPPWDRELRAFKSEQAYMGAALALPALVPWLHPAQSEPTTPVLPMGSLQNLHRCLVVDGSPVAVGIQPIGDALCHTNPTFAYGASLAIHHAFTLARIAAGARDGAALAVAFDEAVGADAAARFDAVSAEDRDRLRLWGGEPIDVRTPADSIALFLRMTAYPAAAKDPDLFRAVARRVNLLDPPDALQRSESLILRAQELGQAWEAPPAAGPSRDAMLEAIGDQVSI